MIKCALNGSRRIEENPDLPVTLEDYARDIACCLSAGISHFHIHFRDGNGDDSLEEAEILPTFRELKRRFPEAHIGIGSPLYEKRNAEERYDQVSRWKDFSPDYISVNISEEGLDDFVRILKEKKVPMEFGIFTMEDAEVFLDKGLASSAHRILIETAGKDSLAEAKKIYAYLHPLYPDLEYLFHGEDVYTYDVIAWAKKEGLCWRYGLEDYDRDREGRKLHSNQEIYEYIQTL